MISVSNLRNSAKELSLWLKPSIRKQYIERYGWKRLAYDIYTIGLLWIVSLVWYVLYLPVGLIFLLSLLTSWIIEGVASKVSRSVKRPWSKRAHFSLICDKESEERLVYPDSVYDWIPEEGKEEIIHKGEQVITKDKAP